MKASGETTEPARLVPLEGTFNFRDLGGYPTEDGRQTRWGRIFRSDALGALTPADRQMLRTMGLATVLDLRGPEEAGRAGVWPEPGEGLHYVNLPVIPPGSNEDPTVPTADRDGRAERYLWYLDAGRDAVTRTIGIIADGGSHPLVFHCAAGKDRTGIIAAMTLAAVGVTREAIVADYVATGAVVAKIMDRLRADPIYRKGIDSIDHRDHLPDAEVMERFLDGLERRHGGAEAWMRKAGMPASTVPNLQAHLLD